MRYWFLIAISLFAFNPVWAESDSQSVELLEAKLLQLDGVVAEFDQQISNAQGYLVEQSSGALHLDKPRFRWEVTAPFPQIILADGNEVQVYDPDLEQVTERTLGDALHEAPLAMLTQQELDLAAHYSVALQQPGVDTFRFTLSPNAKDALFERMEIVFVKQDLRSLAIYDHTGQQTLIRFTKYLAQQVIQSDLFELDYPPGTDFVRG